MKKKTNKKSKNKSIIKFIIPIILLLIIVIVIMKIIGKTNAKGEQQNKEETYLDNPKEDFGLIDMNNKENVQITEGKKQNISKNVAKDRKLEGLEITEIDLSAENGISNFTATVKNNTNNDFVGKVATIQFINKDGSKYASLEVYIPDIASGQTNTINAATTSDIANAYDFEIILQK